MPEPNVRLRPNVICMRVCEADTGRVIRSRTEREIAPRLTYFELRDLREVAPYHFPQILYQRENLTREQRAVHDAFLRERQSTIWSGLARWRIAALALPNAAVQENVTEERAEPSDPPAPAALPGEANSAEGLASELHNADRAPTAEDVFVPQQASRADQDPNQDSQERVVHAPLSSSMLVLAPPGTGKTESLIGRLCHLLDSGEFDSPADEIVVLSFTRAAVAEVRRRVRERRVQGGQDDLRYINVRTFDSFATHALLMDLGHEEISRLTAGAPNADSYSARIQGFVDLLVQGQLPAAEEAIRRVKCLLVDEIQDLGGSRAVMVLEITRRVLDAGGAVCLLGDPAQGIYDFQTRNHPGALSSRDFLNHIRQLLPTDSRAVRFTRFHRFRSERIADFVARAREAMGDDGTEPDGRELQRLIAELGSPVRPVELPGLLQTQGRLAVLTRSNLETFQFSHWCRENGLPVRIHQGSSEQGWPAWMARVLQGFRQERMSFEHFRRRWSERIGSASGMTADEALASEELSRAVRDETIDLRLVRRRVRDEAPPASLEDARGIVVSTIHKSKGLEFDHVLLLEPNHSGAIAEPEEVRVLYVAATRARKSLRRLARLKEHFRGKRPDGPAFVLGRGRWKALRRQRDFLDGLSELDPDTLLDPVGVANRADDARVDVRRAQDVLWSIHQAQGLVELRLVAEASDWRDYSVAVAPPFGSSPRTVPLCMVSWELSRELYWAEREWNGDTARDGTIATAGASALATVAFDEDDEEATAALGQAGLALLPVPEGLIRMVDRREEGDAR